MNAFQKFVSASAQVFESGKKLPPGNSKKPALRSNGLKYAPTVLIFSPHPDDESIVGGLALRLLREAEWNVVNVAMTLGSKRERQGRRRRELQRACASLGFDLLIPDKRGLERINPETRRKSRAHWQRAVKVISGILAEHRPRVIFVPHENDGHPAHIGAHFLVLDALKRLPRDFGCFVVETEFWGQMTNPNLLVESSAEDVADLVAALACHAGEMRRNPYHARLPAWMMDNVRRAEIVGGRGKVSPDFTFATIYRLSQWRGGKLETVFNGGKVLSAAKSPASLFGAVVVRKS